MLDLVYYDSTMRLIDYDTTDTRGVLGLQTLGGDKGKGRKAEGLKNEVAGLEAAVQAASQEYERVKLRNTQVLTSCLAYCLSGYRPMGLAVACQTPAVQYINCRPELLLHAKVWVGGS